MSAAQEPSPEEAAKLAARVKRLMMISGITTAVAVGGVVFAIGYKLFTGEGSRPALTMETATLPKGARIISTAAAGDRLVVTVDVGGGLEIRTYDARSLKPTGRLGFASEP